MLSFLRSRSTCTEPREQIGHNEHMRKSFKEKTRVGDPDPYSIGSVDPYSIGSVDPDPDPGGQK
jgi:hypothetical protein